MSKHTNPLVVELFCGRFGWSKGFVANSYRSIGFDIAHEGYHGSVPEGCSLALQDVLTLHGSQFRDAACIVASPPCQRYSYMAMPFSRGKREARWQRWERDSPFGDYRLNDLFDACFRIQREASAVAGRHIPMVVENVKGAQPWVGPAKAHFGSFYLWGDVESIGGRIVAGGLRFGATLRPGARRPKIPGQNWSRFAETGEVSPHWNLQAHDIGWRLEDGADNGIDGTKAGGDWFGPGANCGPMRKCSGSVKVPSESGRRTDVGKGARFTSRDCGMEAVRGVSGSRKAASAMIAEIPFALSDWLARCFHPDNVSTPQRTKYPIRAST